MEEYLQYMKTLRSQMNDVEDQAAKVSVEEQTQIITIQDLMKEIDLAKSETKQLKEDSDIMMKAKGDMCSQILERQRKIALLENDSSTLSQVVKLTLAVAIQNCMQTGSAGQTLELIQQERVSLSTKLVEKRTSYGKTEEEIIAALKEQQDWLNSYTPSSIAGQHGLVNTQIDNRANESAGNYGAKTLVSSGNLDDAYKNTMTKLDAAKAKFDMLTQRRSGLAAEHHKVKQSLEKLKHRMNDFKPELRDTPSQTLEEEIQALVSDKRGETEYQESMQSRINTIKGISHTINCACGEEYKVEVELCV